MLLDKDGQKGKGSVLLRLKRVSGHSPKPDDLRLLGRKPEANEHSARSSSLSQDAHRPSTRGPSPIDLGRASSRALCCSSLPELLHDHSGFQRKEIIQEEKRLNRRARDLSVCGESKAASLAEIVNDRLQACSAVKTPRVPGDELWRGTRSQKGEEDAADTLDKEGLAIKVPTFLTKLTGASRDGARAVPHLRPPDSVFEPKKKHSHGGAKKNKSGTLPSVTVPISAKQWLLQAIGLKDSEIREMFDQMESIPQLAAEYVREVRIEWEALEARVNKVPPAADFLVKDRVLLEKVRELIVKFIRATDQIDAEAPENQAPDHDSAVQHAEGIVPGATRQPLHDDTNICKDAQSVGSCGQKDAVTDRSESPNDALRSFIPVEDYVINKYVVQPELLGKSDCKATYSPCDKRWYTVVFPALQPGKREDAQLLGEWLQHALQKNQCEVADGRFKDVESAFLLHCIAFLEIVRQVDIHCEERGNLLLHLWRQLLRIFNQVMVRAEPVLNATEHELKRLRYNLEVATDNLTKLTSEHDFYKSQYEVVREQLKGKEVEVTRMKRCRLCCSENMTPRSREKYLTNLKRRSISFRFTPSAVDAPPPPLSEEDLKKLEEDSRRQFEERRRQEEEKEHQRQQEEAEKLQKLQIDSFNEASWGADGQVSVAGFKESSTQTDESKGLRRCQSAPPDLFPRRKEEEKAKQKSEEEDDAADSGRRRSVGVSASEVVAPGEAGGAEAAEAEADAIAEGQKEEARDETVEGEAAGKEDSEGVELSGEDKDAGSGKDGRLKEFENLAVDTIGLLDKLPMEGALADKIESLLKKYCEMTGTVLSDKVRDRLKSRSDSKVSFIERRGSDMNRKSRKSKGSKWGSQLKSYVPLGFAKMMKIYNPPKNVKFFNVRQLTKLISLVYVNKVVADAVDDSCNNERQTCCEFVYDFMLNQYGLKGLSESAIFGLFKTIKTLMSNKEIEKHHKIRLFSRFVGMDDALIYTEPDLYLYLKVLQKASSKPGVLLPSDQDDGLCYLNASQCPYITDEPNLVAYFGSQAAAASFVEKYVAKNAVTERASPEIRKITKESEVRKVDWDLLMEAILAVYPHKMDTIQEQRRKTVQVVKPVPKDKATELENLFIAGDANQDGVLTFSEFKEIVTTAAASISEQSAIRMFRETLLMMPDGGDSISPHAFAQIAYNHGIEAPASVVFDLLKKTWTQIQDDIDPTKVKVNPDEYEFLREALLDLMQQRVDVNSAVQSFRQFVLTYCTSNEEEEPVEEEQEVMDDAEADKSTTAVEIPEVIPE